jgi:tRNA(Ile)-lysidine synthetase-like protein
MGKHSGEVEVIAVSGGPDSMYLVYRCREAGRALVLAHFNHRSRGKESDEDQRSVESLSRALGIPLEVGVAVGRGGAPGPKKSAKGKIREPGFEKKAREERHPYLREMMEKHGAKRILMAHTADDQVETILMRVLEGAGISGLKGIPRTTEDGIERPLLSIWREDILRYLKEHKIPFRVDKSNLDTRFERNWVRHILLPLLEKRYGKSVRKRILTLGERFREVDIYVEENAYKWMKTNISINGKRTGKRLPRVSGYETFAGKDSTGQGRGRLDDSTAHHKGRKAVKIPRKAYAGLPSILRIRILQILCFQHLGKAPNERLLHSMDRTIISGGPSARLSIGRGAMLRCRYGMALLISTAGETPPQEADSRTDKGGKGEGRQVRIGRKGREKTGKKAGGGEPVVRMDGPGVYRWRGDDSANEDFAESAPAFPETFRWEERGRTETGRIRRLAQDPRWAIFDGEKLPAPLSVRGLKAGDRIRPFGLDADKKVKEILIDRKVPREQRWGRPVVCDAEGKILWIPGVLRSAHAPVTQKTRRAVVLRAEHPYEAPLRKDGLHRGSSMLN